MPAGNWLVGAIVAKLTLDKSGWTKSVNEVLDDGRRLAGMSDKTAKTFKTIGTTMGIVGGAIVGVLGTMVKAAADEEVTFSRFEARLKSTGGVVGFTRDQMYALSESLAKTTLFTHEQVLEAEAMGMTYKNISGSLFPKMISAATDLASAMGTDLESATRALGRALQDPANGLMALRRAGVVFTADQKKVVKALVETGQTAKAQQFILDEVAKRFGGSALAATKTFTGQLHQLKKEVGEVGEDIGKQLLPVLKDIVAQIRPVVEKIAEWIRAHPELVSNIVKLTAGVGALLLTLGPLLVIIPKIVGAFKFFISSAGAATIAYTALAGTVLYYITCLMQLKDAKEAAAEADRRGVQAEENRRQVLWNVAQAAGYTKDQFAALTAKYGENLTEVRKAITAGKEGVPIQNAMAEAVKKNKEINAEHAKGQKNLNGIVGDYEGLLTSVTKKQKTWGETLQEWGVLTVKEQNAKVKELLEQEEKLNKMFASGELDARNYAKGIKVLNDDMKELGQSTETQVLPPMRDFSDVLKNIPSRFNDVSWQAGNAARMLELLGQVPPRIDEKFLNMFSSIKAGFGILPGFFVGGAGAIEKPMVETAQRTSSMFDELYNDIATGFGDLISNVLSGATSLKDGLAGLWDLIKESFFRMIGECVTKWTMGFIAELGKGILGIGKSVADTVGSAVKGVTSIIGGVANVLTGGLATGIGAFLGTFLGGLIGGGPSGHQQQQQINDTKDLRNYAANIYNWLFSAGSGFGGASYNFITEHLMEKIQGVRDAVMFQGGRIYDQLKAMPKAQHGLTLRQPGFVMTHGTPTVPEIVAPLPAIQSMTTQQAQEKARALALQRQAAVASQQVHVNINGQIITDREYVRQRLIPEILSALETHFLKSKLQRGLGVA